MATCAGVFGGRALEIERSVLVENQSVFVGNAIAGRGAGPNPFSAPEGWGPTGPNPDQNFIVPPQANSRSLSDPEEFRWPPLSFSRRESPRSSINPEREREHPLKEALGKLPAKIRQRVQDVLNNLSRLQREKVIQDAEAAEALREAQAWLMRLLEEAVGKKSRKNGEDFEPFIELFQLTIALKVLIVAIERGYSVAVNLHANIWEAACNTLRETPLYRFLDHPQ